MKEIHSFRAGRSSEAQETPGSSKTFTTSIGVHCLEHQSLHLSAWDINPFQLVTCCWSLTLQYITALGWDTVEVNTLVTFHLC